MALGALSDLAVAYPGAVDALEQAYAGQPSATARRQILIGLCQLYRLPPGLADFLAAEVDNCDADVKVLAVDRLLRHNAPNAAMLAHWLEPHQPSGVKERVLQHLLDRSLAMGQEVAEVLRTEREASAVARGAESLLDPLIDLNLRRALAAKIARVPQLPTGLRATLAEVSEHTDDPILRSTCRQVLARSRDSESTADEEIERWLHQVEVEESVEAVFPGVFARYDANPSLCAKILKACVLNPACREKLYYNSFPLSDTAIIRFLISRDALDDDLCRYCVDQALTTPGPGWYVRALCCRPDFAGLVEAVWRVLEGAGPTSAAYHNSMRDLMVHAFGSENAAVGALQSRLGQLTSPASAVPYMRFLNDLRSWPAVRTVIADLLRSGRLLDPTNRGILGATVNDLFPEMAPQAPGPGLADE